MDISLLTIRYKYLLELFMNCGNAVVRINHPHPAGVGTSPLKVGIAHPAIVGLLLSLEAIRPLLANGPSPPNCGDHVEQYREIGLQPFLHPLLEDADLL